MPDKPVCPSCGLPDPEKNPYCFCKPPKPRDLYELFNINDQTVQIRANLNRLGHHIRKLLATGQPAVTFQFDRDVAAVLADILIIDDSP